MWQCGADPNITNVQGRTPMYQAVANGLGSIVRALASRGVPLRPPDGSGLPLLHVAVNEGHAHLIGELVELGADVDERDGEYLTTALMMAVLKGDETAAKLLLAVSRVVVWRSVGRRTEQAKQCTGRQSQQLHDMTIVTYK